VSPPPTPVLFDTDIGGNVDDALALALALASPAIELRAVSVVNGDAEMLDLRARIVARLLGLAGRADVPVLRGVPSHTSAADPNTVLDNGAEILRDANGNGDDDPQHNRPAPPRRDAPILDTPATQWLLDASTQQRLHVVGTGPFTTIAAALHGDPGLSARLDGLTVMGGMVDPRRFPDYWRQADAGSELDYNSQCDPQAALACARSGVRMTWVPIEVTLHTQLTRADLTRLRAATRPFGQALAHLVEVWGDSHFRHRDHGQPDAVANLHDPLAMASLLPHSPEWLTVTDQRLDYAIDAGLFTTKPATPGSLTASSARVATRVDAPAFARFYLDRVLATFG
jgi:purine nucleosidase